MGSSNDLINFDIIEAQKENVQSLPGGRSARELARIFSAGKESDLTAVPSPNDTRTLNDAIRREYEAELQSIDDCDDPLDVYDRYVKWTLNAYPSAQATPESCLLPLLERATKAFLSSQLYKNDPRYLRLWLHYIRLFSDAPRETFAFLARHNIGEGLALYYEEFAAWLETAGRWNQAEEIYKLGIERDAHPPERLFRKFGEFQKRFEQRTQDMGPSSPALPAVRPALAVKVDPFATAPSTAPDPQAQSSRPTAGTSSKSKSGKAKMSIFSDADATPADQPALGGQTKGWENIGSLHDRKKENQIEAKPWAGETLKAGKKPAPVQKMAIFRDEVSAFVANECTPQIDFLIFTFAGLMDGMYNLSWRCIQSNKIPPDKHTIPPSKIPEHHVREAVNPRTGRRERVFVSLEAVYPDYKNPAHEFSFEELRAISRGWMQKDWSRQARPLKPISGNVSNIDHQIERGLQSAKENGIPTQLMEGLELNGKPLHEDKSGRKDGSHDGKISKVKKLKLREIKEEPQTIKMNFDSPTKPKIRRRSTAEPTMTIHTRAATDEIYSIFNQPLKAETDQRADSLYSSDDDDDDDDYTSAGESTGTGQISVASSECGEDETFHKSFEEADGEEDDQTTRTEQGVSSEWTEFTVSEQQPSVPTGHEHYGSMWENKDRDKFIPEMPEDYHPPCGPYRDPAIMAQNRLPFMTPIVEQTEYSLPSMTVARNTVYNAKTPSKQMQINRTTPGIPPLIEDILLSSPGLASTQPRNGKLFCFSDDAPASPTVQKLQISIGQETGRLMNERRVIISDTRCNPTDRGIRDTILEAIHPPLASYRGYHVHTQQRHSQGAIIQKYVKSLDKRPKSGDHFDTEPPILDFPGAERSYAVKRELGAGAYAPVYLAESLDNLDDYSSDSDDSDRVHRKSASQTPKSSRFAFEAIKIETGPPCPWEFYMIRTAGERLSGHPVHARAAESIIRAHELHVFGGESFLIEDYRGQGTLLDLVNLIRAESLAANANPEAGMDEALAMFFTVELFRTVEALHACGILHGDIKADNCLVRFDDSSAPANAPSLIDLIDDDENADPREIHYSPRGSFGWRNKGLSLIDFGRGIDMLAFQPSVQFIADWETGVHECNEIREMRPWTHQIDLYGIAGTVHVMLFGKYIESVPMSSSPSPSVPGSASSSGLGPRQQRTYRIRETLKRYWDREIGNDVFDLLLNPGAERWVRMECGPSPNQNLDDHGGTTPVLPVLRSMKHVRQRMEGWLVANAEKRNLSLQIRKLEAIFAERRKRIERR